MSESLPALITDFLTGLLETQATSFSKAVVLPELKRKSATLRKIRDISQGKKYRSKHLPFYLELAKSDAGYFSNKISIDEDDVAALLVATKAKTYEGGAPVGEKALILTLLKMYKKEIKAQLSENEYTPTSVFDAEDSDWLEVPSVSESVQQYLNELEANHDEDYYGEFDPESYQQTALEHTLSSPSFQRGFLINWADKLIELVEGGESPQEVYDYFTENKYPDLEGIDEFSIPFSWGSTLQPEKYTEEELDVLELYKGTTGRRLENLRVPVSFLLDLIYGDRDTWEGKINLVNKKSGKVAREPALKLANAALSFNRSFSISVSESDAFYLYCRAAGTTIFLSVKSTHSEDNINYTDKATLAAILQEGPKISLRVMMQDVVDAMLEDIGISEGTQDYSELSSKVRWQTLKDFTANPATNRIIVRDDDRDSILAIIRTFCRRVGDSIVFGRDYIEDDLYINAQFGGFCIGAASIEIDIDSKERSRRSLNITASGAHRYLVKAKLTGAPSIVHSDWRSSQFITQTPYKRRYGHTGYILSLLTRDLTYLPVSTISLNTAFNVFDIWVKKERTHYIAERGSYYDFNIKYNKTSSEEATKTIVAERVGGFGVNTAKHYGSAVVTRNVDLGTDMFEGAVVGGGVNRIVLADPSEDFLEKLVDYKKKYTPKTGAYALKSSKLTVITGKVLPITSRLLKAGIPVFQINVDIASRRILQLLGKESFNSATNELYSPPLSQYESGYFRFLDLQYEPVGLPISPIILMQEDDGTYSSAYSSRDNEYQHLFFTDPAGDTVKAFCGLDESRLKRFFFSNTLRAVLQNRNLEVYVFQEREDDGTLVTATALRVVERGVKQSDVGRSDVIYKPAEVVEREDNSDIFTTLGFKEKSAEELSKANKIKPAKNTNFSAAFYSFVLGFTTLCRGREHLPSAADLIENVVLTSSVEGQLKLLGLRDFREALYSKDNPASAFSCLQNCIFWPASLANDELYPAGRRPIYDMVLKSSSFIGAFFKHYIYGMLECALRPITLIELHEKSTRGISNPAFEYETNTYASKGYYKKANFDEDYRNAVKNLFGPIRGYVGLSGEELYSRFEPVELKDFVEENNLNPIKRIEKARDLLQSEIEGHIINREELVSDDLKAAVNLIKTLDLGELRDSLRLTSITDYSLLGIATGKDTSFAAPEGDIFQLDSIDSLLHSYNDTISDFYKTVQPFLSTMNYFEKKAKEDWAKRPQEELDKLPEYRFYNLVTGSKKSKRLNKLDLVSLLKDPRTDHPVFKKIQNNPIVKSIRDGEEYSTLFALQDAKNSVPLFFLARYFHRLPIKYDQPETKPTIYPNSDRPYNRMSMLQYSALVAAIKISYAIEMKANSFEAFGKPVASFENYIAFQPTAEKKTAVSNLVKLGNSYGVCFGQEGIDYQRNVKAETAHFLAFAEGNGIEYGGEGFNVSSIISFAYLNKAKVSESKGQDNTISCTRKSVDAYGSSAYRNFDDAMYIIENKMDKGQAAFYAEASIALDIWKGALPWSSGARKYTVEDTAWLFILLAMRELVVGEVPDSDDISDDTYPVMKSLAEGSGFPVYPPDEDSTEEYIESFNKFKDIADTIPFRETNVTVNDGGIVNNNFWKKL